MTQGLDDFISKEASGVDTGEEIETLLSDIMSSDYQAADNLIKNAKDYHLNVEFSQILAGEIQKEVRKEILKKLEMYEDKKIPAKVVHQISRGWVLKNWFNKDR